ncbi:MAG: helix-turn-helix domain-containing protein [Pseudomonadota bacterium]
MTPELHVDAFAATLHGTCGAFHVEPVHPRTPFRGAVATHGVGGLALTTVSQNAQAIRRSRQDVRRDPEEHYFLVVQQHGTARLRQEGDSHAARPGDLYLVDNTRPVQFDYGGCPSTQLSLHLPRDAIRHRFGQRVAGDLFIGREEGLGQALCAILGSLDQVDPTQHTAVTEAFFSLFGTLLLARDRGERATLDPQQETVRRALNLLHAHFRDPACSVSQIAAALNVSVRHLQRAFGATEAPLNSRLQRVRVEAAHRALADGARSVSDVAFAHGYNDLSTFHRHFGLSPGAHQRRCRALQECASSDATTPAPESVG